MIPCTQLDRKTQNDTQMCIYFPKEMRAFPPSACAGRALRVLLARPVSPGAAPRPPAEPAPNLRRPRPAAPATAPAPDAAKQMAACACPPLAAGAVRALLPRPSQRRIQFVSALRPPSRSPAHPIPAPPSPPPAPPNLHAEVLAFKARQGASEIQLLRRLTLLGPHLRNGSRPVSTNHHPSPFFHPPVPSAAHAVPSCLGQCNAYPFAL